MRVRLLHMLFLNCLFLNALCQIKYKELDRFSLNGAQKKVAQKNYQLKDHLGNIRVSIVDNNIVSHLGFQNFYPYGSLLTNSKHQQIVKYGFQEKEYDSEFNGSSSSYNFHARIYDPRAARWLTPDPLEYQFPNLSTYNAMKSNPVYYVDADGRSAYSFLVGLRKKLNKLIEPEDFRKIEKAANHGDISPELDAGINRLRKKGEVKIQGKTIKPSGEVRGKFFWNDYKYLRKVKDNLNAAAFSSRQQLILAQVNKNVLERAQANLRKLLESYHGSQSKRIKNSWARKIIGNMIENRTASLDELLKVEELTGLARQHYDSIKKMLEKGNEGALLVYESLVENPYEKLDSRDLIKMYEPSIKKYDNEISHIQKEIDKQEKIIHELEKAFIKEYGE